MNKEKRTADWDRREGGRASIGWPVFFGNLDFETKLVCFKTLRLKYTLSPRYPIKIEHSL